VTRPCSDLPRHPIETGLETVTGSIADTGYLLAFGALPEGNILLGEIFSDEITAPPTVFFELADLIETGRHGETLRAAAQRAVSPGVAAADLTWTDVPVRRAIQQDLSNEIRTKFELDDDLSGVPPVLLGRHAGESEVIAIAIRVGSVALINDAKARKYASDCNLEAVPAPVSLKKLAGRSYSGRDLLEMHKIMDRVARSKVTVSGPLWFLEP
jgi:hypothetical protein